MLCETPLWTKSTPRERSETPLEGTARNSPINRGVFLCFLFRYQFFNLDNLVAELGR